VGVCRLLPERAWGGGGARAPAAAGGGGAPPISGLCMKLKFVFFASVDCE
jgi:hypothetical protein